MNAAMLSQIDALQRDAGDGNGRISRGTGSTGDREHAAIMHRIARSMKDLRAASLRRRGREVDRARIPPLRKVWHDFKNL